MPSDLLIIQPSYPSYRVAFFEGLAQRTGGLTLLHFGAPRYATGEQNGVREVIGSYRAWKSFRYIDRLDAHLSGHDTVVAALDPHWWNAYTLALRRPDLRVVYWAHGLGSGPGRWLRRLALRRAASFVTYHETTRQTLVAQGLPAEKLFTANNTIAVANHTDLSDADKSYFLYVGRLQARKEVDAVVRALAELRRRGTERPLYVVGPGDAERDRLRRVAREADPEALVRFHPGTTDDAELKTIFAGAWAYVSPGHVGLGVLHSFAYGVPVIAYRDRAHAPEHLNLQHQTNGLLVGEHELETALSLPVETYRQLGQHAYAAYRDGATVDRMIEGFYRAVQYARRTDSV